MAEKRPLLNVSDGELEHCVTQEDEMYLKAGVSYRSTAAPTVCWYLRHILLRRKVLLGLLVIFICSYFLIGPANILEMDGTDNIVPVHHQSSVLKREDVVVTTTSLAPLHELTLPDQYASSANHISLESQGYLVYSNHCKLVDLDPYKREIMRYFKRVTYKPCKHQLPLTQVRYDVNSERYALRVDPKAVSSYKIENSLSCCYMSIKRLTEDQVAYSKCYNFKSKVRLSNTTDNIIVKCSTDMKQIYINGHAMIPERATVREQLNDWRSQDHSQRVPSVLLIGIDSISRVNLIRAMPKTAQYLYDNEWFELAGYNKIDDNTFPNIMALMTGYNLSNALEHCSPYHEGGLDNCDFLWKLFKEHGFVTAYGEDAYKINTFNYLKKGFKKQPVDYYLRPYLDAVEKQLDGNVVLGLPHCVGFETESEHVYNYALEFARRYRNDSFFGFFWTNTHSHSDLSQTSSMDDYLKKYLQRLIAQGTMEHSVVVFLSDHGMRFGPTRSTWSGHLEERLPFLFIWLPPFLRKAHPEFVQALRQNRNRLTTPYDLHMTLKHILTLSGRTGSLDTMPGAKDCPQCQSLLLPVTLTRSCEDVAISDHWCTCWTYETVYRNSKTMRHIANSVVHYLNDYVNNFRNGSLGHLCTPLALHSVSAAYRAERNDVETSQFETYWLIFYTSPNKAQYETTVRYSKLLPANESVLVTGSVSRLNMYNGEADCMNDIAIKKYCYCRHKSG